MQLVKLTKFGVFGTFSLYEFMIKINGNLRTWPEKTENNCLTGPAAMTFEDMEQLQACFKIISQIVFILNYKGRIWVILYGTKFF